MSRESSQRSIFVGDVHGCLDELQRLLKQLRVGAGDRLVLVGDLVAKGPDSQGVVACAREHGALGVRGNHDEAVLRYLRALARHDPPPRTKNGHIAVARSLLDEDVRFLEGLPLWLRFPELDTLVVHAGVVPGVPIERQDPEHLMTMRSLRADGSASSKLEEGVLWGTRWRGPEHVVFGHDALTGLQQHPFATGLDTGCVYGGSLSALVLPEKRIVSVPAKHVYKEISA
ncbi:MAG TPA: metallophosphoesterase [Polyangiales bacterium]